MRAQSTGHIVTFFILFYFHNRLTNDTKGTSKHISQKQTDIVIIKYGKRSKDKQHGMTNKT